MIFAAPQAQAGFQWTAPAPGTPTGNSIVQRQNTELPPRNANAPVSPVASEKLPASMDAISAGAPISTMPDGPVSAAPVFGIGSDGAAMTNDPITWNPRHNNADNRPLSAAMRPGPTAASSQIAAPRAPQNIMPAESVSLMPAPVVSAPIMAAPIMPAAGGSYGMYDVAQGFGRDLPLVMAIRQIVPAQYGFVFADGIDMSAQVSWQGGRPWDIVLQETLAPLGMTATINGNTVSIGRAGMMQNASWQNPGPQMMTETVATGGTMTMAATPVAMTAPAAVVDDMGGGQEMSGYAGQRIATNTDLLAATTWTAPRNSTLRTILEGWSERVGVELYWASEYDYPVQSAVSIQGTFEEAVQTLLKGLVDSKPRPLGRLHPNLPNGPAVLVIETRQSAM